MSSRRTFLQTAACLVGGLSVLPRRLRALNSVGNTYFVDTAGDNRHSGSSAALAWADFTNVNNRSFLPGDSILLKRGCVWHQRFTLNGAGSPGRFITVAAYGKGPRPKIQMSGNQADRCMRLNNASYVRLSSVEVCDGGVGVLLYYDRSYNNRSVYIDDVVAHDFQCTGVARENPRDRVSWCYGIGLTGVDNPANGQDRVLSDLRITNTEVYNTGAGIALDWANHHTVDGKIALRNKFGDVYMEKLRLHDNTVSGVAFVSLFLSSVTNCTVKNTVINKGARYAPTGTSAVQVMYSKGVTLQNVTISNTLFDPCPDNSGLDLECDNEDTVVDGCTFENNAGPAIEILATPGNANPYTRNFVIRNCKLIGNNWAKKLGNFQISVPNWQEGNTPSGRVHNNRYQNAPGTAFFGGTGNTSQIQLADNTAIGI
jgi:Right handed beta helix region